MKNSEVIEAGKKYRRVGRGWEGRLRDVYASFSEFAKYSNRYGLAKRLGFASNSKAWATNPVVRGSVNPEDYKVVK